MNKYLLSIIFIICVSPAFAQRFSQYNTGTLYDSFENPAQRAFIPDSSRTFAFNFFVPTGSVNGLLTGNTQNLLLQRSFIYNYKVQDTSRLKANSTRANHVRANASAYLFMFKLFSSLDGDQELGISFQTRAEGQGTYTDQAAMLFSGQGKFVNNTVYNNVLNNNLFYQAYNEISFSYREKISKQFALGIKLNSLLGIYYNKLDITRSALSFDNEGVARMALQGNYYQSYIPGTFTSHDLLPNFRNPGASISIGTMLRTQDGFVLQWNIKDLGFIHWSSRSSVGNFADQRELALGAHREDSVYKAYYKIVESNAVKKSFTTPVDGRAEFSAARTFYLTDDEYMRYTPALILSKQLFYAGMEGALVNHIQYHNAVLTLTGMYNDLRVFSLGTQFMIKSPNVDFFIGSDALAQTIPAIQAANKNENAINRNSSYTAASLYLGFSLKFGTPIEHPMNANTIPNGEKGFFGRLYNRLFRTYK